MRMQPIAIALTGLLLSLSFGERALGQAPNGRGGAFGGARPAPPAARPAPGGSVPQIQAPRPAPAPRPMPQPRPIAAGERLLPSDPTRSATLRP